jgi:hypothetical protein
VCSPILLFIIIVLSSTFEFQADGLQAVSGRCCGVQLSPFLVAYSYVMMTSDEAYVSICMHSWRISCDADMRNSRPVWGDYIMLHSISSKGSMCLDNQGGCCEGKVISYGCGYSNWNQRWLVVGVDEGVY